MQADANRTPDRIDALPGLGPKSRDMLAAAGITTPAQMEALEALYDDAATPERPARRLRSDPGNSSNDSVK
jgi:predicted flap endonuclease-1-like 5' DNA nuclease